MTDPERISKRGTGLAAQLLRSSVEEAPNDAALQRTLTALGVAGAVLTTTTVAGAAGVGATSAVGTSKAITGVLLLKWVGVGVVSGIGLAGAATLVTAPASLPMAAVSAPASRASAPASSRARGTSPPVAVPSAEALEEEPAAPLRPLTSARESAAKAATSDPFTPLAAEVAYVDRARAQLAAGQAEVGLSQLARYEREFPEPRLLPEVLFLQLETYQRLGRNADARLAAERLVTGFPKSPHAARARAALGGHFP